MSNVIALKQHGALFMYKAIKQALDDMEDGFCVCPATKKYLEAAIERADTGRLFFYNSESGEWYVYDSVECEWNIYK